MYSDANRQSYLGVNVPQEAAPSIPILWGNGSVRIRNGNGSSNSVITANTLLFGGGSTRITFGDGNDQLFVGHDQKWEDPTPAVITTGDGSGLSIHPFG
jgi:hypothetical protein